MIVPFEEGKWAQKAEVCLITHNLEWKSVGTSLSDESNFELFCLKFSLTQRGQERGTAVSTDVKQMSIDAHEWGLFHGLRLHFGQWFWGSCHNWWNYEHKYWSTWKHLIAFKFWHDNDPKLTVNAMKAYLCWKRHSGTISVTHWPPQSSDLTIIEAVWDRLGSEQNKKQTAIKEELQNVLQEPWRTTRSKTKDCLREFRLCWGIKTVILPFQAACMFARVSIICCKPHQIIKEWGVGQDWE